MEADDEKILWIKKAFKVFHIEPKSKKKKPEKKWSPYDMLPHPERYGQHKKSEYADKLLCWHLAGGDTKEFDRLYTTLPASEVEELYAIKQTYDYQPD